MTDTVPKLVSGAGLAPADARALRRMQRRDLRAALAPILMTYSQGERKQRRKTLLERWIAFNLALYIAEDAAKPRVQELARAPCVKYWT